MPDDYIPLSELDKVMKQKKKEPLPNDYLPSLIQEYTIKIFKVIFAVIKGIILGIVGLFQELQKAFPNSVFTGNLDLGMKRKEVKDDGSALHTTSGLKERDGKEEAKGSSRQGSRIH